jgi:hypothetical protein
MAMSTLYVSVTAQQMITRIAETIRTNARKNGSQALPWGAAAPR